MEISAKVISASESVDGCKIITLELVYPRFIHSEFMTHRAVSKNTSSSRAIPVAKYIDNVINHPVIPLHWGKNKPGMQASGEIEERSAAEALWLEARDNAVSSAYELRRLGVHKQVTNRILEPFSWVTVLATATEWENLLALRIHPDAQPEFKELAMRIKEAINTAEYSLSSDYVGTVHAPYTDDLVNTIYDHDFIKFFGITTAKRALVSVGRCCRVSYLTHGGDNDPEADIALAVRLLTDGHMSPFEHVAFPYIGVSANFHGWKSLRKYIPWESNFANFSSGNYKLPESLKKYQNA